MHLCGHTWPEFSIADDEMSDRIHESGILLTHPADRRRALHRYGTWRYNLEIVTLRRVPTFHHPTSPMKRFPIATQVSRCSGVWWKLDGTLG